MQPLGTPRILNYFIDYFVVQPAFLQLLGTRRSLIISLVISLSSRLCGSCLEPCQCLITSLIVSYCPAGFPGATWNPRPASIISCPDGFLQLLGTRQSLTISLVISLSQPSLLQPHGTCQSLIISLIISLSSRLYCSHMEPRRSLIISFWLFHYPAGFAAATCLPTWESFCVAVCRRGDRQLQLHFVIGWNPPILDYLINCFDIQPVYLQPHGTCQSLIISDYFIDYFNVQPALLQPHETRQCLIIH